MLAIRPHIGPILVQIDNAVGWDFGMWFFGRCHQCHFSDATAGRVVFDQALQAGLCVNYEAVVALFEFCN